GARHHRHATHQREKFMSHWTISLCIPTHPALPLRLSRASQKTQRVTATVTFSYVNKARADEDVGGHAGVRHRRRWLRVSLISLISLALPAAIAAATAAAPAPARSAPDTGDTRDPSRSSPSGPVGASPFRP